MDERAARIQLGDMTIGYIGEASKELGFKTSPCMVELDIDLLVESSNVNKNTMPCHNIHTFYVTWQL